MKKKGEDFSHNKVFFCVPFFKKVKSYLERIEFRAGNL